MRTKHKWLVAVVVCGVMACSNPHLPWQEALPTECMGSLTIAFPKRAIPKVIPDGTTDYELVITSIDSHSGVHYRGTYKNGDYARVSFPAGRALVDVAAYGHSAEGVKVFSAGGSEIVSVSPAGTTEVTITLRELNDLWFEDDFRPTELTATVRDNPENAAMALITVSSVSAVTDMEDLVTTGTIVVYERDDYRSDYVPRTSTIVDASSSISDEVDIAFVIDNTGSMSDEISGVRSSIQSFVTDLENEGFDIRLAAVGYLDETFRTLDFTGDVGVFTEFLSTMATGGGTELAYAAIVETLGFSWRETAQRTLILITDENADDSAVDHTTTEIVDSLRSRRTVAHIVYNASDGANLKPVADETDGLKIDLPISGVFDLTQLPLGDFLKQSFTIQYSTGSANCLHQIRVVMDYPGWGSVNRRYFDLEAYF